MKKILAASCLLAALLIVAGCSKAPEEKPAASGKPAPEKASPKIEKEMAKLSPESRKHAEAQKRCPITDLELGTMGMPVEIKVKDQTVFLCCEHCQKKAQADPDKTLAKVKELKAEEHKP